MYNALRLYQRKTTGNSRKEKERTTKRDPEEFRRKRNEGEQLDIGTNPEMDTRQNNMISLW